VLVTTSRANARLSWFRLRRGCCRAFH
jgi:hypothetical protein